MRRGAPTVRNFSLWQVVRVEFPYADQPVTRKRPALVIAIPDIAKSFRLLWLIMITSARHDSWLGDVVISDLSSAGLSRPSYVRRPGSQCSMRDTPNLSAKSSKQIVRMLSGSCADG
jgi:hypothetical protein